MRAVESTPCNAKWRGGCLRGGGSSAGMAALPHAFYGI